MTSETCILSSLCKSFFDSGPGQTVFMTGPLGSLGKSSKVLQSKLIQPRKLHTRAFGGKSSKGSAWVSTKTDNCSQHVEPSFSCLRQNTEKPRIGPITSTKNASNSNFSRVQVNSNWVLLLEIQDLKKKGKLKIKEIKKKIYLFFIHYSLIICF